MVQNARMDDLDSDLGRPDQAVRLAKSRQERGFSDAKSASNYFGWNYTSYSQHERGERGLRRQVAERYAKAFRVSPAWLLTGEGRPKSGVTPIVGYAAAGADSVTFADGQGPFDEVEAPSWANETTVAVRVRGTSLGLYFDGWLAFYDNRRDPPDAALVGALCVCGLSRGRVVIKKLRAGSAKGLFHLESETEPTLFDERVEWAAEVKEMRPR
jgi:hypothetical protein